MKDEEFIELETKRELYNKKKPVQDLRLSDFIPIVGMINRLERCPPEKYNLETSYRLINAGLTLYNLAIIPGTIVASGLVGLLSK